METAETLKEKIDLLGLSEDERGKLEEKFAPSLSYVSVDDEEVLNKVFEIFKQKFEDEFNFVD